MENNTELSKDMNKLLEYIDKLERKVGLYANALLEAGKYARNNEPSHFPEEHFEEYLKIFVGGMDRDPMGREFVAFWLNLAK